MINSSDILQAKILIVDDQAANILLLERMLRGAGYTSVTSTTNPNEVSDLHNRNCYDLILLDLEMPGEAYSGFQVMAELKEIETEHFLPVIVVTAHPDHKVHALEAGARDFISKPFEMKETLARIHNVLETRLLHVVAKNRIKALEHALEEVSASNDLLRRQCAEIQRN
jgi:adenylate cyclase